MVKLVLMVERKLLALLKRVNKIIVCGTSRATILDEVIMAIVGAWLMMVIRNRNHPLIV